MLKQAGGVQNCGAVPAWFSPSGRVRGIEKPAQTRRLFGG